MELRVLKYFLEVARQGNITKAAEAMNVTQPTLSRQLKDLEWELGEKLFVRTNYAIRLTPAGQLLLERAQEIVELSDKTLFDFKVLGDDEISGEISIAAGESKNISFIAECINSLKKDYPKIRYNLYAGDSERVLEKLDKGLFDFAVIFENVDLKKYNCLTVKAVDRWGVIMRRDDELAVKRFIRPADLFDKPVMVSRQALAADLPKWFGDDISRVNVVATLDLAYNGSVLAKQGTGYLMAFDGLVNTGFGSPLCFRPLKPPLTTAMNIVWRKHQQFTKAGELFLNEIRAKL
ncbi:MAG: LysR family transcriptional regulator [Spirochaetia bacterium]|nr:LysR family transcriptional regulator [Spirochaetia bacterium]